MNMCKLSDEMHQAIEKGQLKVHCGKCGELTTPKLVCSSDKELVVVHSLCTYPHNDACCRGE